MATIIESDSLTIVAFKRKRNNEDSLSLSIASNMATNTEVLQVTTTKSGITNAGFSSTPKKALASGQIKCDRNSFIDLEIKSIAALVSSVSQKNNFNAEQNPALENDKEQNNFEVHRNPPKKKTKKEERDAKENACFENAGLNLALPEKQFNPFEVIRDKEEKATITSHCFTNAALNLKDQDTSILRNPFEISRDAEDKHYNKSNLNENIEQDVKVAHFKGENENARGESEKGAKHLKITLPFQPTVGCRINFQDISLSELSPSKLLADKLVFSPSGLGKQTQKSSKLSVIAEEESSMDIGKELDRYQLELENSINEAKLYKNDPESEHNSKGKITSKLQNIKEDCFELKQEEVGGKDRNENDLTERDNTNEVKINTKSTKKYEKLNEELTVKKKDNIERKNPFLDDDEEIDMDELYGEDISDISNGGDKFLDDNGPAPFVRNYYRTDERTNINNLMETKGGKEKTTTNVGKLLRRSIRKFINHHQDQKNPLNEEQSNDQKNKGKVKLEKKTPEKKLDANGKDKGEQTKENSQGFMNTLRRSLRRKQKETHPTKSYTNLKSEENGNEDDKIVVKKQPLNVSIIDKTERTLKLKSDLIETEYLKIEDLTVERKPTGLRSSIRRTLFQRKNVNEHHFKHN